ncbi:MAG: lycopene cyclase family protein, partial [Bacteroidota bacterium]
LESQQLGSARILILDKDAKKDNDRTWSFWSKDIGDLAKIAVGSWERALVFAPRQKGLTVEMDPYRYYTIEGLDYYNYALDKIRKAPNVTFQQETIIDCFADGRVQTQNGNYQGRWVFKSYFTKADLPVQEANNNFVWQHFKGWEIQTEEPAFDPEEMTLMDFRVSDDRSTKFFYVLPFSAHRALIEYTEFSKDFLQQEAYDARLRQYIRQTLGIDSYQLCKEEFGAIPMTDYDFGANLNGQVLTIGTMAGYVKPSSGYCFTRTLERNQKLVQLLETGQAIDEKQLHSNWKYQWYDAALLHILSHQLLSGHEIFYSLFKHYQDDLVFKFLDEDSNVLEDIKIMSVVPGKAKFAHFLFQKSLSTVFYRFKRLFLGV